jgi:nucleotide-binding universal stress UspA family protein/predicted Ser/Thr protein kinase
VTVERLEAGAVVDGFRVGERVHAGGMALIYRVTAEGEAGPLVMKVPRLGPGEPATCVISYEVEQTLLSVLKGPHVPRLVASGDLARQAYLVMEYVEGRSLSEWEERAPLPAEEVARLGAALARAVHAIHLQDAVHLDLKPSNVLVRPSGEMVLIDFGLAHHAHYPDLLAEEYRRPIGSAPYISPEQVLGVRSDPRSDLFAVGVILYELATARLPFGSPVGASGLRQRLYRDPAPPRACVPDIPEWLQEIILHCLEPEAGDRYASAAQLALDLDHPDQVAVGERGRRRRRAGPIATFRRFVRAGAHEPVETRSPSDRLSGAPIVLAAIATLHRNEAQSESLREAVRRVLGAREHVRVACATVIRPVSELGGSSDADTAARQRVRQVVELRHWAEPLQLEGRVSFHVLESTDPAGALLEYARANHVDHIVIGAPPPDLPLRGIMQTVSTKVALEAPCTVTLARPPAVR